MARLVEAMAVEEEASAREAVRRAQEAGRRSSVEEASAERRQAPARYRAAAMVERAEHALAVAVDPMDPGARAEAQALLDAAREALRMAQIDPPAAERWADAPLAEPISLALADRAPMPARGGRPRRSRTTQRRRQAVVQSIRLV